MKKRILTLLIVLCSLLACCGIASACSQQKSFTYYDYTVDDDAHFSKYEYYFYGDWDPPTQKPSSSYQSAFYRFGGFFLDERYENMLYDADMNLVGDLDDMVWYNDISSYLYTYWIPDTVKVNFEVEGKLVDEWKFQASYGSAVSALPVPEKEGYDFVGWMAYLPWYDMREEMVSNGANPNRSRLNHWYGFDEGGYDSATQDVREKSTETTLHAVFALKKLTVTYDSNNGTGETAESVFEWGTPAETLLEGLEPPGLVYEGKMLAGWSLKSDVLEPFTGVLESDLTVYAVWLDYKTFRFVSEGGAAQEVRVMQDGKEYDVPGITRPGYEFQGWYDNEDFEGEKVTKIAYDDEIDTYYAKWKIIEYTITFDSCGGSVTPAPVKYTVMQSVELPTSAGTKEHCTLAGWCREEDCSDEAVTLLRPGTTGNFTMYAKWRGELISVTLDPGDGSIASRTVAAEYGTKVDFGVPYLEGYRFGGWFTLGAAKVTGEDGVCLEPWTTTTATTLVARYSKLYNLTLVFSHDNAGTVEAEQSYIEKEPVKLLLNQTEDGYIFVGFYKDGNQVYAGYEYEFEMPANDLTIEVRFEPRRYTVQLDYNGGTQRQTSAELSFGETYVLPTTFMAGKLFQGWFLDETQLTDEDGFSLGAWTTKKNVTLSAGFEDDPDAASKTTIVDAAGFLAMKDDPEGQYALGADINLQGKTWTPFEFKGTLQGNGFTVKNLSVTVTEKTDSGIFTALSGTVKNLNFENLNVTGNIREFTKNYVIAGICGELTGTIESVVIKSGRISGGSSENNVVASAAGFAGRMTGGTIKNCENRASVTTLPGYLEQNLNYGTGGIVAYFSGGTVSATKNYGAVTGISCVGGIIGRVERSSAGEYSDLANYGAITGTGDFVGGIFGFFNTYYVTNSSAASVVRFTYLRNGASVAGRDYVGGIVGRMRNEAAGEYGGKPSCGFVGTFLSNESNVTGKTHVGGIAGYGSANGSNSTLTATSSGRIVADAMVGGIVGEFVGIALLNCSNEGTTLEATGVYAEGEDYRAYVGGYAGKAYDVENCHNSVSIRYTQSADYVGGVVGYSNGALTDCSNDAQISASGADCVGGVAGYTTYTWEITFSILKNSGSISGNDYVGGLIGRVYNDLTPNSDVTLAFSLANGRNTGSVSGASYVGGIAGDIYAKATGQWGHRAYAKIVLSFIDNSGFISGDDYVGGFVGNIYCNSTGSIRQYNQTGTFSCGGSNGGALFGKNSGVDEEG